MCAAGERKTVWALTVAFFCGQTGLFALSILIVALATPLHLFLFERLGAAARLGLSDVTLREIAYSMTSAMRGAGYDALSRFFGPNEVLHMQDVRALVVIARRAIAVLALVFAAGMAFSRSAPRVFRARAARNALILCFSLTALIALSFRIDFYRSFVLFHRIFFPGNELWLMDPATDFMVVVYNQAFFTLAAACVGALCCISLAPLLICWLNCRKAKV